METIDFSLFLKQTAAAAGIDQDTIPNSFFTQMRDFADRRVAQAWDRCEWPGTIRYNAPSVSSSGNLNKFTYPTGADVILNVYSEDPRQSTKATSYSFTLTDDGTNREVVIPDADTSVTVEYKEAPPSFFGDNFKAGNNYSVVDQVYANGNFYKVTSSLQPAGVFSLMLSQGHVAIEKKIPKIFQSFLVRACYADYLKANGQTQQAAIEEQQSELILFREIEKVQRVQGQHRRIQMNTY